LTDIIKPLIAQSLGVLFLGGRCSLEHLNPLDKKFMELAIAMAKMGWGATNPNPLVGAVVVKDDQVISRGYHRGPGEMHAETEALYDLGDEAKGATLYVNLEPCCHYGKTPPCVSIIKEKGVKKVVAAMKDPNPKVNGKGIDALKQMGIEVVVGVLEEEAAKLNEIFIKYISSDRPFVIMKSAMTLDGKIACENGDSFWVSGEEARNEAQYMRRRVSAIMVGLNTVINDNPKLTVRVPREETRNPLRIIVDSMGKTPLDSYIVKTAHEIPTLIATTEHISDAREEAFLKKGVVLIKQPSKGGKVDMGALMRDLHSMEIDSILLEGGSRLNASCLEAGVVDKVMIYVAPKILGGEKALTSVGGTGINAMKDALAVRSMTVRWIGEDLCIEGYPNGQKNRKD